MTIHEQESDGKRSLGERILLACSRQPGTADFIPEHVQYTTDNALDLLRRVFPDFLSMIHGKKILDFGCGTGHQTVALALAGAGRVVGLDTNAAGLERAREFAEAQRVTAKTEFVQAMGPSLRSHFDIVISKDSMEHFSDPAEALKAMAGAIHDHGKVLITFGPPWLAPYGSHMHFFTRMPWVQLLFSERTVMSVRRHYRQDGATRYEEVEGGLNKMTVSRFERLIEQTGMKVIFRNDEYVKNLWWPGRIPRLREFFINQVSCILGRP